MLFLKKILQYRDIDKISNLLPGLISRVGLHIFFRKRNYKKNKNPYDELKVSQDYKADKGC